MKIKIIIRENRAGRDGKAPLALRFTHERISKMVALGVSVEPRYWDKAAEMLTADCPERAALQTLIDSTVLEYQKRIKRLEVLDMPVNFDTLFETKGRKCVITIEDGFKAEISRLESLGKINSAIKHRYALQVLSEYESAKRPLESIDTDYLKGLELFLRQRGNKDNSIATRFAIFKAIYNRAIKEGRLAVRQNPFSIYQVGSLWATTRKRAIEKSDIQRLAALVITEQRATYYQRLARDMFLFSYYTAGMNFGDMARLRYNDIANGRVSYARHKTQKLLSFQLSGPALQILDKYSCQGHRPDDYIFPILNRLQHDTPQRIYNRLHKSLRKINQALKLLGEQVGLSVPLTTYVARHTFATVLKRSDVSVALISESLGHSDLSTTQIYLDSFENSQIDAAMANLL